MVIGRMHQRLRIRGHFQRSVIADLAALTQQVLGMAERMRRHLSDFFRHFLRRAKQIIMRHNAADKAPFGGLLSTDHIAGVEKLRRSAHPDDARQDPCAAIARNDAEFKEGHAKLRLITRDPNVAEARHIAAEPDRWTIYRCDHRHAQAVKRAQDAVDIVAISVRNGRRIAAKSSTALLHSFHIAASRKGAARTGKNDAANIGVFIDRQRSLFKLCAVPCCAKRVHRLGPVNSKAGDVVGGFDCQKRHNFLQATALNAAQTGASKARY